MSGSHSKAYVLTGTPGAGKTSLLLSLQAAGEAVFEEPARRVLYHQLEIDGPALPSKDPHRFVEVMLEELVKNHDELSGVRSYSDRGIPDLIAYARRFDVSDNLFCEAAKTYRYNKSVFMLEPWEEIFENDDLRRLTYEDSLLFHETLVDVYTELGYDLVPVPKVDVVERARFVLEYCKDDSLV